MSDDNIIDGTEYTLNGSFYWVTVIKVVQDYLNGVGYECGLKVGDDRIGDMVVQFEDVTEVPGVSVRVWEGDVVFMQEGFTFMQTKEDNLECGAGFFELADPRCFDLMVTYLENHVAYWGAIK